MSFKEQVRAIDITKMSNPEENGEKNTSPNSQIDKVVLYHLNEIKNEIKSKAAHGFYYYNSTEKTKTIYGKIDLLRCSYPMEDLFSFMYKYNNNDSIRLTESGIKVYERLKSACSADQISIKIGKKLPMDSKPREYRDWYINSLYRDLSSISNLENPYQVYVGYEFVLDMTKEDLDNLKSTGSDGCYIATSVYGSYDCPEVWTLRRFRDFSLGKTRYGRMFIKFYYAVSPTIVKYLGNNTFYKLRIKRVLDRFVLRLQKQGFENKPYEDYQW